jgi:hypothetical protein
MRPDPLNILWCGVAWKIKLGTRYEVPLNILVSSLHKKIGTAPQRYLSVKPQKK